MWVDVAGLRAGVDFLSKIGQAIIDAKVTTNDLFWLHSYQLNIGQKVC